MSTTTRISVRALALGGKFVGQHVGFVRIDIYGPEDAGKPLLQCLEHTQFPFRPNAKTPGGATRCRMRGRITSRDETHV